MDRKQNVIFTDGASRGNPGPGGWGAVLVEGDMVLELGGREDHTTNNRMELAAAIGALSKTSAENITLYTDSSYLINGITKWVFGWQKKDWITAGKEEVLNRDLWEDLIAVTEGKNIEWRYVGGHAGIPGNERCDEIATGFADGGKATLYIGPLSEYKIDILNVSYDEAKKESKSNSRSRSKAKAYSYLSMVDGKVERHETWVLCEKRVKGVSGAKFKKSLSVQEENEIIEEWKKK